MISKIDTFDWNIFIASITLIVSITTPAVSLFLNNVHQRKLKKIELKHALKLELYHQMEGAFNNFIDSVSAMNHFVTSYSNEYEVAYHRLFLYVPKEYWQVLKKFNNAFTLSDKNSDDVQKYYSEVTETLAALLQESHRLIPT